MQFRHIVMVMVLWWASGMPFGMAAQSCTVQLSGQVLEAHTRNPLPFATIFLRDSSQNTVADESGQFLITNICPGTYTVVCQMVGYAPFEIRLALQHDTLQYFLLEETAIQLKNVEVTAKAIAETGTQQRQDLEGTALESGKALGLGEALKRLPGITTLNTGHSISKPMIQGLNGNRIVLLNNGVRLEAQQWGDEHAPEIDPFIAAKVSVVKGAAGVRYGADAMGGVVLVEPEPLREKPGVGGQVSLGAFSNGRTGVVSASVEGMLSGKLPLSGRLQGTFKRGGNVQTPDYFQRNTGVEELNYSWALGLQKETFSTALYYSVFSTQLGILRDAHIGNLTDLNLAIERGRPLEDGAFTYEIGRPMQQVLHELLKWQFSVKTGEKSRLEIAAARQFNRRQEFDAHRPFGNLPDNLTQPQFEFEITTYTVDANLDHRWLPNTKGSIGVQGIQQRNTTDFGALIPNYTTQSAGIYWVERWRKLPSPWEVELGMRYDHKGLFISTQGADTIAQDRVFGNFSGTTGVVYHFAEATLRLNAGTAWRAPHPNELYSDGVHHGAAAYELGDPNLQAERALNLALSANWTKPKQFAATISLYHNRIADFIYLEPQSTPKLTIRGAFPAFHYRQADAALTGFDWNLAVFLNRSFTIESQGSVLRAWNREAGDYLTFMPADRFTHAIRYAFGNREEATDEQPFVRLGMTNVLRQSRVPQGDLAPPPPGYTRFDAEAGTTFQWGKNPVEIGISVFNLFNARYRDYLNRFRYFTDELGRNVFVRAKITF